MRTTLRHALVRGAAALTGSAVALSLVLVAPSAQAAGAIPAPSGADPAPVQAGAGWLKTRLVNNLVVGQFGDDYGLSIDAALALDAVGGHTAVVSAISGAVAAELNDYITGEAFGDVGSTYAGPTAKALVMAQTAGDDATSFGGVNLVQRLEQRVSAAVPNAGRISDQSTFGDFANTLGQAFAASALNNANSHQAGPVLSFLLGQQCTAGFFREQFSATAAPNQTCDGAVTPTPSLDATALSVVLLQDQKSKTVVRTSLLKALDWLVSQQAANGSFNSGNANSTGLAGWALGVSGRTSAAEKAASWLRSHQLANAGTCATYAPADNGAIVLDDLGLVNAVPGPMDDTENRSATRATAQALPALLWAAGGTAAGATTLTGPTDFVRAGSAQTVTVRGAPGNTLCVTRAGVASRVVLDATGSATVPVTMPATTSGLVVSTVDAGGEADSVTLRGLAKAALKVKLGQGTVTEGDKVKVTITGLAAGEPVTVTLAGKKAGAVADAQGKAKVALVATKVGAFKIKAVGGLKVRKGKASLTVTA